MGTAPTENLPPDVLTAIIIFFALHFLGIIGQSATLLAAQYSARSHIRDGRFLLFIG